MSGLLIEYKSSGSKFGRIQKLTLYENIDESDAGTVVFDMAQGGFLVPQTDLISICTSKYIASFLTSFDLKPKDENGDQYSDLDDAICRDTGGNEVKLWYSLMRKLASFPDKVPVQYCDDASTYWRRSRDLDIHP